MNKEIKFDKNLIIIIVLFIVVFVLGFLGWMEFYENIDREVSNLRITVLTAGLFYKNIFWPVIVEHMGIAEYNIPVLLNIARLTAPLLLAYAVFFVVISIFKKTALIYFYRFFKKDYTIIVGYNERVHSFINNSNKISGDSEPKEKLRFVLFTEKENIPLLEEKNLIIFDNEKEILKKVMKLKPLKANKIILWHEDDLKNKEILMTILQNRKAIDKLKKMKDIFIHLETPLLSEKMKRTEPDSKLRIHTFSIYNIIASSVVDKYAPDQYFDLTDCDKQLKIIIFGFDSLGYHVLVEMLQMYIFPNLNKLQITLIDNDIEKKKQKFFSRYGAITQYADIDIMEYSDFLQNFGHKKIVDLDMCFTCFQDPMENDFIAKKTRQLYFKMNADDATPKIIQIMVNIEKENLHKYYKREKRKHNDKKPEKKNDILYDTITNENKILNIETAELDEIINYDNIIQKNKENEKIAEQIHEFYRRKFNLDMHEWKNLNDYFKEENLYVARHLHYKMRYLNYKMISINEPGVPLDLSKLEKTKQDMLAEIEHDRWNMRKILNGYIHGDKTDSNFRDKIKIHKDIVAWDQLTTKDQEKDYTTVENIQTILSPVGMKVVRSNEYKVFIALFGNLKPEREVLENKLHSLIFEYNKKGVYIKPLVWQKNLIDLVNVQEREYFDKKLKECEIGVFMFRPKPIEYTPKPIENTEDKFLDACSEIKKINNYKNNFIFFENINDFSLDDIPDNLKRFKNNKKQLETIVDFGSKSSTMKELTSNLENCLQSIYEKDINNGRKQVNKEYKVFFASSGELKTELKELEKIIESLNKDEKLKGSTFQPDICKWSLNDISNTQRQEYFEKKLKESDIHIFILESKLGEFSEEKLFKACEESTKTDNPKHTFIYFRDIRINGKEIITENMIRLKKFKDKLDEIKWIYNLFSTTEDFAAIVSTQLELIAQKELYSKIK